MRGVLLLRGLLQMIVLSHLVCGFFWREASSHPGERTHNKKDQVLAFRKPSEVFRKLNKANFDDDGVFGNKGQGQLNSDDKQPTREESLTFKEYTSFRQSLRNERRGAKYPSDMVEEARQMREHCERNGNCMEGETAEKEQIAKSDILKDEVAVGEGVNNVLEAKKDIREKRTEESKALEKEMPNKDKEGGKEDGTGAKVASSEERGDSLEEKLLENRPEKVPTPANTEKDCERCFSIWYSIPIAIVGVVSLINCVFIAWMSVGTQNTSSNKKIPTAFGHTSHSNSVHHKLMPPSTEYDLDKGSNLTQQVRVRPPVWPPKSQKGSMSTTTVTTLPLQGETGHEATTSLAEESQLTNLQEAPKKNPPSYESCGTGYKTASLTNQRSHINHKLPQNNLSPISENSNEDSVQPGEHLYKEHKSPMRICEENSATNKLCEPQAQYNNSTNGMNDIFRRDVSTTAHLSRDNSECYTSETHSWGRLKQAGHAGDSQTSCKSCKSVLPRNEGQGEPCHGATEMRMNTKDDRGELIDNTLQKKGSITEEYKGILSSMSIFQDVGTQSSLREDNQTSISRSVTHMANLSSKHQSNVILEKSRNTDSCEGQKSALQLAGTNKKLMDDKSVRKPNLPQAKSGKHYEKEVRASNSRPTKESCSEKLATSMPKVDVDSRRARLQTRNIKSFSCAAQGSQRTDQLGDKSKDNKLCEEQKDKNTQSPILLEGEDMAPPPLGYHVRKDVSNPDSSLELVKNVSVSSYKEANVFRKHIPDNTCHLAKLESSNETVSYNGNLDKWSIVYPKQQGKDSYPYRYEYLNDPSDMDKAKRSRKLVIIGKLNCFLDDRKRKGKIGSKAQLIRSRENKNMFCELGRRYKDDPGHGSKRVSRTYSKVIMTSDEQTFGSGGEKIIRLRDAPKSPKTVKDWGHLRSMDNGVKYYCKVVNNKNKNIPTLHAKRNARHQSMFKLSNGVCLKRISGHRDPMEDKSPLKRSNRTADNESGLKMAAKTTTHSLRPRSGHRQDTVYRNIDLMSPHMNINSNAGIYESFAEETVEGKQEARLASGSSILNSKQCFRTHVDSEGNSMITDVEVLRSTSLTQKRNNLVTNIKQQTSEPLLIISKSNDQIKQHTQENDDENQMVTEGCYETLSQKANKKQLVQTYSDKNVFLRNEKQTSRSHIAMKARPSDSNSLATSNIRKKKTQNTDTITNKLENTVTKKTTMATILKNDKRLLMNKPRLDQQKQPSLAGDVQKAVVSAVEKSNKNLADSTRFAKMIKSSEGQNEYFDTKLKQKESNETNLFKEANYQTPASQKIQTQEVRSVESDHQNCPPKIQETAYKSQDVIKRLVSSPKTMTSQPSSKKSYIPQNYHVYTSTVRESKYISEVKSIGAVKLSVKPASPATEKTDGLESCCTSKKVLTKTGVHKIGEFLMKEFNTSPGTELNNSPRRKLNSSSKRELYNSPKWELFNSPKRELSNSPKRELSNSPKRELSNSPKRELRNSPKTELSGSPKMEFSGSSRRKLSGSLKRKLSCSPKRKLSGSPKIELSGSPKRELSGSLNIELSGSPKIELSRSSKMELSDSPQMEFSGSPKMELSGFLKMELSGSPQREPSLTEKKNEETEQTLTAQNDKAEERVDGLEETIVPPKLPLVENVESVKREITPVSKSVSLNYCLPSLGEVSQLNVSLECFNKHISRKPLCEKTAEDINAKEDPSESVQGKLIPHIITTKKKKCLPCYKSQSRSPDSKRKKRVVRKSSIEGDLCISEKAKKIKSVEKLPEKKKKKKKVKQKTSESTETSETRPTGKAKAPKFTNDASDASQTHQTAKLNSLKITKESSDASQTHQTAKSNSLKITKQSSDACQTHQTAKSNSLKIINESSDACQTHQIAKSNSLKITNESSDACQTHQTATTNAFKITNKPSDGDETQIPICPMTAPSVVNTKISEKNSSPITHSIRNEVSIPAPLTAGRSSGDLIVNSLDRLHVRTPNEKSHVTSSAVNISLPIGSALPALSNQKPLNTTVPPIKTSARIVQISTYSKVKKNEKNLQEAELGWNSSTFSNDEKVLIEKVKLNQKRAKVRYYIVKTKPKKTDKEIVASKLKRPAARPNLADHDDIRCSSQLDINDDIPPQEKSKAGLGKSVQFSDNIQDLEASKGEAADEWLIHRPDGDNSVVHPITKSSTEILKPPTKPVLDTELSAMAKSISHKKEDLRSQITPPKRKRPVWSKKYVKDKRATTIKTGNMDKQASAATTVKHHHSSDTSLKPSSRFNIHVYYPVKPAVGSPKLNTSPREKRKVSYNTWINSILLSAPLNKTLKKLVAKTGSPVDIKEIIEGSSVDGTDHLKTKKHSYDGSVRAAKSVTSLGQQRALGTDSFLGRRARASEDLSLTPHKKFKEIKIRENWSPRAQSVMDTSEDCVNVTKSGLDSSEKPINQDLSTDIDKVVLFKKKAGHSRFTDHGSANRRETKTKKKTSQESPSKWQLVAAQDERNAADLNQVHYRGDMMELNVLNMGLAWVVQSVVRRLPFFNPRQHDPTTTSSSEVACYQQLLDTTTSI